MKATYVDVSRWPERVDTYSATPLHAQLYSIIEAHLRQGQHEVGDHLPGEQELCNHFSVSRPTLRHALAELEADAWIERRPGIGTTIIREPAPPWLLAVDPSHGFSAATTQAHSAEPVVEVTGRSLQPVDADIAETLGTDQAVMVERVLRIDDIAVGSSRTWLSAGRFGDLLTETLSSSSVSETLTDRYGSTPGFRVLRVRSIRAAITEAKLFKLPPRAPVLEVRVVGSDVDGSTLWYGLNYYNGSQVVLEVRGAPGSPSPPTNNPNCPTADD